MLKDRIHTIILLYERKTFEKYLPFLYNKVMESLEMEGTYFGIMQAIHNKPLCNNRN